jgi:hypothetical protein
VSESHEGYDIHDISNLNDIDGQDSAADISSRKFSYDELSHVIVDGCLTENECEEMSHLLQEENRKCESVCRKSGSRQGAVGFVFLPSSLPPPLIRQTEAEGRGKFRDRDVPNTSTSCAVSSSSSEESFQSPSVQLLQQNRKSLNDTGLSLKQLQTPTLPARPWTVGPSNSGVKWVSDVASVQTDDVPAATVGSQSPLLSVVPVHEDPANAT